MRIKELLPLIYDNFDAFHTMCLSTALMSTYNSKELEEDSHKIIHLVGDAFKLGEEVVKEFKNCILGDMMSIGLITDYQAVASTELLSDNDKENIELYEIKGRVLEEVAIAETQTYNLSDIRALNQIKANMKYEYFHHPYNAKLRFWQLKRLSNSGNVDITRQVAMLYVLGIGCEKDLEKAEENLLKCILWGDKISALLLNKLNEILGKEGSQYQKIFLDKKPEDTKLLEYWQLRRLLNYYLIAPKKELLINNELAKTLISDNLSFKNKVDLIANLNEKTWRNAHMLMENKENCIGFRVRKNE